MDIKTKSDLTLNEEFWIEHGVGGLNPQMHSHEYTELLIIVGGTAVHNVEGLHMAVSRGDVAVVVPGFSHNHSQFETLEYYILNIDVDRILGENKALKSLIGMQAFFVSSAFQKYRHIFSNTMKLNEEQLSFVVQLCVLMTEAFQSEKSGSEIMIEEYLHCLMVYLSKLYEPELKGSQGQFQNLEKTKEYIEENYLSNIKLVDLAKLAMISERHYDRLFKQIYECSPIDYIGQLRLNHSLILLRDKHYSITQVSEESGFADLASFSKYFKKKMGKTPNQYRKSLERKGLTILKG